MIGVRLTDHAEDSDGYPRRSNSVERLEVAVPVREHVECGIGEHERLCGLEGVYSDYEAFERDDVGWEGEIV